MRRPPAWSLILLAALLQAPRARAALEDDEPTLAPDIELRDVASDALIDTPHRVEGGEQETGEPHIASPRAPLWIAITGGAAILPEGSSFNAMLLVSVPLDRFGYAPRSAVATRTRISLPGRALSLSEEAKPALKPPPRRSKQRTDDDDAPDPAHEIKLTPSTPSSVEMSVEEPTPPIAIPAVVTADSARAAVRAALKSARLEDAVARVSTLASRARAAALLPELRLRASRLVDEAQHLSPTEYDAARITASGGTSIWLEARATWRLDRVAFADEEVALERMRHDRSEAQAKLADKVLELLFAWQRARALEVCPGKTPEEQLGARLRTLEAEASLDVLTGGWFSRWRRSR